MITAFKLWRRRQKYQQTRRRRWSMRLCGVHRSGRGGRRNGGMQSAQGSTIGMATPQTTAQAAPTSVADDVPTNSQSRARTIPQHHRPGRSFHRRPSRSDTEALEQHTDTSRVRCTLRSRPERPDTLRNDSPTQRTVPGSRRNGLGSTVSPISSVTSSTSAACDAAVTPAV